MKAKLALFAATLFIAGCSSNPVRYEYIPADVAPVGKVCDPTGWWCQPVYAPASSERREESPSAPIQAVVPAATTSTIILFQRSYVYPQVYAPTGSCCQSFGKNGKWWRW